MKIIFKIIKLLALLTITNSLYAKVLPEIKDLSKLTFKLQTFSPGLSIPEKYGHIQLRVQEEGRFDQVVSWGMYDFQDPNFLKNFLKGHTNYRVIAFRTGASMRHYKKLKRTFWEHDIVLSSKQKQILYDAIQMQLTPPNNVYLYDFFKDNCSTRIRDLLDLVVSGGLKKVSQKHILGMSYRDTVRKHQSTTWMTGLGLSVWANHTMDQMLTGWEAMYLPSQVMVYAEQATNESGFLLINKKEFGQGDIPEGWPWWDELGLIFLFVLPFLFFFIKTVRSQVSTSSFLPKAWISFWWVFTGFLSTIMVLGWLFSDLVITHHSANLWLLWPTDFLVAILLWFAKSRQKLSRVIYYYAVCHVITWFVHAGCTIFGFWEQQTFSEFLVFGSSQLLASLILVSWMKYADPD